jgi:hypothetical protein
MVKIGTKKNVFTYFIDLIYKITIFNVIFSKVMVHIKIENKNKPNNMVNNRYRE